MAGALTGFESSPSSEPDNLVMTALASIRRRGGEKECIVVSQRHCERQD